MNERDLRRLIDRVKQGRLSRRSFVSQMLDVGLTAPMETQLLSLSGVAADGKSVVWKLKQGVTWHDGKPFTADDVVFTYQYANDPGTAAVTSGSYKDLKLTKVDQFTVRFEFAKAKPFWADAFVGVN